jgi:hypothetical protein
MGMEIEMVDARDKYICKTKSMSSWLFFSLA